MGDATHTATLFGGFAMRVSRCVRRTRRSQAWSDLRSPVSESGEPLHLRNPWIRNDDSLSARWQLTCRAVFAGVPPMPAIWNLGPGSADRDVAGPRRQTRRLNHASQTGQELTGNFCRGLGMRLHRAALQSLNQSATLSPLYRLAQRAASAAGFRAPRRHWHIVACGQQEAEQKPLLRCAT